MTRKQRRLTLIGAAGCVIALALGLVLYAMSGTITFFFSPSEAVAEGVKPGTRFRLGGLVKDGSILREDGGKVSFVIMDANEEIRVDYTGILPDLFREGQGVIAEGALDMGGAFKADSILAKHDENYMPREVADSLKKQGHWQDQYGNDQTK
ncbi:cytochrome c maturation protein CcmE [Microvirga sp. W0021]|uniref:Cytochrome c-type biogenesis protein CcmE n=1 Tax=Hohaiivirga grylli TaxID=3133970 RepID=A0ABV0BJI7_9HYPH